MEINKFERGEFLFLHGVGISKTINNKTIFDLAQKILSEKYVKESDVIVEINTDGSTNILKMY